MQTKWYDKNWLNGADDDPWWLVCEDESSIEHRDAFVGNGYIGQRIAPCGDGSAYENCSRSYVYGVWGQDERGNEALMEFPSWAVLDFRHPGPMGRVSEKKSGYRQTLDIKTGTVETDYHVQGSHWAGSITRRAYISRADRNLAVLQLEIKPEYGWLIEVLEKMDAGWIKQGQDVRLSADQNLALGLTIGPHRHPVAVASRLFVEGAEPERIEDARGGGVVARSTWLPVKGVEKIVVTRVVAIATAEDSDDSFGFVLRKLEKLPALDELRSKHCAAWEELWRHRVDVPHDRSLKLIRASLYHLYSQLREDIQWSIGPCGISGDGYKGRVFWDADTWVFPPLAVFNHRLVRGMAEYRFKTLDGARENARNDGYDGACIAWESAATGKEWVPFPEIHQQRHVNSDTALAQWQYWLVSGDEKYLREKATEVIIECARYWASRAEYNQSRDRYELRGIYCADEYAKIRDNNAATNYGACWNLRKAVELAEKYGIEAPAEQWRQIADKMYLPWDEQEQIYSEFEGFTADRVIKQADTALMIYPYEKPMAPDLKQRLVDYYRARYPENKIMMSAAFDGIIDCELGRPQRAWEAFMDLLPHYRPPYLVVSESPNNDCLTFTTGLGGMLQLVLMGFAGIRLHADGLWLDPALPQAWSWMKLYGINYGGAEFDIEISNGGKDVVVTQVSGPENVRIYGPAGTYEPNA